ncbi:hypothetical protein [Streptomyces sp. PanSC9]|uniref:hypothetical protein n=1 Tax=Streptomyces sp. PanSC9 TaxID=1520461 RepID=UPI0011CE38F8|nr:hypothetical protein [Streptomyces sp. PanSC9]
MLAATSPSVVPLHCSTMLVTATCPSTTSRQRAKPAGPLLTDEIFFPAGSSGSNAEEDTAVPHS